MVSFVSVPSNMYCTHTCANRIGACRIHDTHLSIHIIHTHTHTYTHIHTRTHTYTHIHTHTHTYTHIHTHTHTYTHAHLIAASNNFTG